MQVSHGGGIFTTRTLKRTSPNPKAPNPPAQSAKSPGLRPRRSPHGIHQSRCPRNWEDRVLFPRNLSPRWRSYISDVVETATGLNLWREWARVEVLSGAQAETYTLPNSTRTTPASS